MQTPPKPRVSAEIRLRNATQTIDRCTATVRSIRRLVDELASLTRSLNVLCHSVLWLTVAVYILIALPGSLF
jgi:hypothetical protein